MVGRMVLAVSLLAGFYVLVLGIAAGLVALTAWLATADQPIGGLTFAAALFAQFMIVAMGGAFLLSLRKRLPPPGVELDEAAAPRLWWLVRKLAADEDVRPPDTIRLVAAANAWVLDDARFWGLRPGKRYLDIGMPLLLGMTVDQLTAILAHELGHYSREDTRLYEVVYRGRESIVDIIGTLTATPWRALLRGYAHLYRLVTSALLRERERAADRFAAAATDGPTLASALRELNAIDRAWQVYLDDRAVLHRSRDRVPADISGDFASFLAVLDLSRQRADLPDRRDRWDSHPPLAERVATLERLPARTRIGSAAAAGLVPDLADLGPRLDEVSFPVGDRERVAFDDFAIGVREDETQAAADVLYRAASAVDTNAVDLAGVLDVLERQRERLAAEVTLATATSADPDSTAHTLATHVEAAMALAAVACHAAWWRFDWATGVTLADDRGRPFAGAEPFGLAGLAATACVGSVTGIRARLTELGVDLAAGRASDAQPRGELLGMMASVTANGRPRDLLIFSTGLVILPVARYDNSQERLAHLVDHFRSGAPADHGWFVPYEDVRAARMLHRTRGSVLFTLRDDTFLRIEETIGAGRLTTGRDDPRQVLRDVVANVAATGAPPARVRRPATGPDTAAPAPALVAAEGVWRGRNRMVLGLLFLLPGVLLTLIGIARFPEGSPQLLGSGIPFTGAGAVLLYLAYNDRHPGQAAGRVHLVSGVLVLGFFLMIWVLGANPRVLVLSVFGVLLVVLGLARRHGRFPKQTGNGWKVAAGAAASAGLTNLVSTAVTWRPGAILLGVSVVLFVIGAFLAGMSPAAAGPTTRWYDLSRIDKASLYGLIGLVGIAAFPVGTIWSVLAVREARKVGRRPPLTAVTSLAVQLLLVVAVVVALL